MPEGIPDRYPPEEKALNAALAAAQGEFPKIPKDKTAKAGSYSYTYASLDTIFEKIRPTLAKHGLSLIQRLENPGGQGPAIRTELRHKEGAVIAASFPIGARPDNPQHLGSLLTYLRRYAIVAMLGIAPEDDDDGQQATNGPTKRAERAAVPAAVVPAGDPGATVITFGKYEGQTIAEVAEHDRQYLGWMSHEYEGKAKDVKAAAVAFLHDSEASDIPF